MGSNDGTVNIMRIPIHTAFRIFLGKNGREDLVPDAFSLPSEKPAVDGAPWTISFREVPPGDTRLQSPENTIDDLPMIFRRPACLLSLGWKQRLKLLPLLIG